MGAARVRVGSTGARFPTHLACTVPNVLEAHSGADVDRRAAGIHQATRDDPRRVLGSAAEAALTMRLC